MFILIIKQTKEQQEREREREKEWHKHKTSTTPHLKKTEGGDSSRLGGCCQWVAVGMLLEVITSCWGAFGALLGPCGEKSFKNGPKQLPARVPIGSLLPPTCGRSICSTHILGCYMGVYLLIHRGWTGSSGCIWTCAEPCWNCAEPTQLAEPTV